jgi:colanic acid/amylovoran biosynthesis protein
MIGGSAPKQSKCLSGPIRQNPEGWPVVQQVFDKSQPCTSVRPLRVCLVGAAPDTTNLGVTALGFSTLAGIACREANAQVTVFDNGRGIRPASLRVGEVDFQFRRCGAQNTRRYYRRESYWNMRVSGWFGHLGNPGLRTFLQSDSILDVSGGDSFCDMYGPKVFRANVFMKHMALAHKIPLILLPQTYGPFNDAGRKEIAAGIVRQAQLAVARDQRSFEILCNLLGDNFDPDRHLCGVDLAFGLEARRPNLSDKLLSQLYSTERPVGINISGLIYNDPVGAKLRYGFRADYRQIIHQLLQRLLRETDRRVILVPHVLCSPGLIESDLEACESAMRQLSADDQGRVTLIPNQFDPSEMKWIIAQTEWFCATRMHAGIAALSSGVPTAAVAYSIKTAGVFETCNQGEHVADPRSSTAEEVTEQLWQSWETREHARVRLSQSLPVVLTQADRQMEKVVSVLKTLRSKRRQSQTSSQNA